MRESERPLDVLQPEQRGESTEVQASFERRSQKASVWLWAGLAAGAFGMCVLCGGTLTLLGVLGAISEEQSAVRFASPAPQATPHPQGSFGYGAEGNPLLDGGNYSAPWLGGYPSLGSDGSSPFGSTPSELGGYFGSDGGGDSLSDSIREQAAERSWWSEEWSRALGENYPEPTHVDPDGNPGWIDHSGAFHDYSTGMSEYESSTLSGSDGE